MIGVVDTSALLRLFVPDGPTPEGLEGLLRGAETGTNLVLAPQLLLAEVGNVLLRKVRREELAADEGGQLLDLVRRLPIRLMEHDDLIQPAFDLAREQGLTVYDALYLSLAMERGARLFTCDDALQKAAARLGLG